MNPENPIHENEPYILIEGPAWGDAEFYGKWLLMAAKAQALWEQAFEDPRFAFEMELATTCRRPDFAISATTMLFQLKKSLTSIVIGVNENDRFEFNAFLIMIEIGFFVLTGERYQMVVPTKLSLEKMKKAALKFARREAKDGSLRPEDIVTTMPHAEAKVWQSWLRGRDQKHRCADRFLLLEGSQIEVCR